MNIIFVGAYDTPDFGGVNEYMLRLSQQLEKKGHHCIVIRRSKRNYEQIIEGVKFINLAVKGPRYMGFFFYLVATRYIINNNMHANVICFQSCMLYNQCYKRLSPRGYKVCCVQHSFALDNPKNNKTIGRFILWMEKLTAMGKVNIITVSEHNARLIKDRLKKDAAIVRCGINLPDSQNSNNNVLESLGLKADDYFLTISRVDPVKNLDVLIKGFLKYKGSHKLVIGGNINNDYGKALVQLASKDNRILFAGPVLGENKEILLNNCFAYILVSSSEGFPISLLEAMSYGKRCVVSDIPPIKEALGDELGFWCKVRSADDVTKQLHEMDKCENRNTLEQGILNRVSNHYTWEIAADTFLNYINDI